MVFNSSAFAIFFACVIAIYYIAAKWDFQKWILIISSFVFYTYVNWQLPVILLVNACFVYILHKKISLIKYSSKPLYIMGLIFVLLNLILFKYGNWINDSFEFTHQKLISFTTLGLSYFTLSAIALLTHSFKKKENYSFSTVLGFMSFFPQLLSGPIPEAKSLLPQWEQKKRFDINILPNALGYIVWGLFKKVVIGSALAAPVNYIFYNYETLPVLYLWLGIILYSFQVYADFSGYSAIAYGVAKLLGFEINKNFDMPLFASSIDAFWRKWHISLSLWLKEHVYFPLKNISTNKIYMMLVTTILFSVSGLWHGANATYMAWGFSNGILFTAATALGWNSKFTQNINSKLVLFLLSCATFMSITLTRVFFRADSFDIAIQYYKNLFQFNSLAIPTVGGYAMILVLVMLFVEKLSVVYQNEFIPINLKSKIEWASYAAVTATLFYLWPTYNSAEYIYFKF